MQATTLTTRTINNPCAIGTVMYGVYRTTVAPLRLSASGAWVYMDGIFAGHRATTRYTLYPTKREAIHATLAERRAALQNEM